MDLIVIRTFNNYFSANILLTRLRSAGMECYLKDEYTVTMDPLLTNAVGGIKLVAKNEHAREIFTLLQQFDEDFRRNAVCPRCGSNNIELMPKRSAANMAAAILSWIFSDYAVSAHNVYQCGVCGFQSETLPEPLQNSITNNAVDGLN